MFRPDYLIPSVHELRGLPHIRASYRLHSLGVWLECVAMIVDIGGLDSGYPTSKSSDYTLKVSLLFLIRAV